MNIPSKTATDEEWQLWLTWARLNPDRLNRDLRHLLAMHDAMAIQLAKLWRTVNRQ